MRVKILMLMFACLLILPGPALAHGVDLKYKTVSAIEVTATYDTGAPLSEGQVAVFSPDNPSVPWSKGKCDENGRFTFTPDPSKPGTWDVQVRLAGHGGMIHIPVGTAGDEKAVSGGTGYSTLQIVVMSASAAWGFIGTALFFSRRKS
jgi:nickel transport protein